MSSEEDGEKKNKDSKKEHIDRGDVAAGATGIPNVEQKTNKEKKSD
jgi:hypothetical protein